MDGLMLCRAIVFVALGWVILISGLRLAHGQWVVASLARSGNPFEVLDRELLRCAELGPQAAADPLCEQTWAQSRRRFLAPDPATDVCSVCDPGDRRQGSQT